MPDIEIINIPTEKTALLKTDNLAGQNQVGGVGSSFKTKLTDIAKALQGWWNIRPSDFATNRNYTTPGTWVSLTNDNTGSGTSDNTYAPSGLTNLWDTTTNEFDFSSLDLGDTFSIRVDLTITTTANNQHVFVRGRWGIGGTEQQIVFGQLYEKSITANVPFSAMTAGPVASSNVKDFPADIQIQSDANFDYKLEIFYIQVNRR